MKSILLAMLFSLSSLHVLAAEANTDKDGRYKIIEIENIVYHKNGDKTSATPMKLTVKIDTHTGKTWYLVVTLDKNGFVHKWIPMQG